MKSTVYMVISIYNNKKEGLSYEFKVYDNKAKANKKFKENINKFIKENEEDIELKNINPYDAEISTLFNKKTLSIQQEIMEIE